MEDQELTKYQLERKISEVINKDNGCTAHFIWEYNPYPIIIMEQNWMVRIKGCYN